MGLALKDSPPGFDPSQVVGTYGTDDFGAPDFTGDDNGDDNGDDDGHSLAETEQL
jgi:DNA-directed RNA polymerase subunit alpha